MELDVGTRALLKIALLPPGLLLVLLLIGWLWAGRVFGRFLILLAIALLYTLSTPITVNWLAAQLETVPALTPTQLRDSRADAIWVLMAGARRYNPEFNGGDWLDHMSLERLDFGLALHRKTGLPLVISGGTPNDPDARPAGDIAGEWLQQQAGVKALAIDAESRDTWENARNSAALFAEHRIGRVLLVTHAYHMPRAMLSARTVGIDAVPAPFGFEHTPDAFRRHPVTYEDWLPRPGYLGRSYLLLHEMAGLVWYGFFR